MKRRDLLAGAASIGVMEWLGFFRSHGVPGTKKDWGIAQARAQETEEDRFLVYWFAEGGWDSYSMLAPVHTRNDSGIDVPAGTLYPQPPWSDQIYRVRDYGTGSYGPPSSMSNIEHGYLAAPGRALLADMCVVASHRGNTFHSGARFDYHYGRYDRAMQQSRNADERTVLQAFCEAKGASFLLPHVSWHRWLSDGELDTAQYPEGTGYYEKLGPAYAHTIYGRTPADLKARLAGIGDVATQARRSILRSYTDDLHARFVSSRDGQSVRSFSSALSIHQSLSDRGLSFDVTTLFQDQALKDTFGVQPGDELTTATVVNDQPARSKNTPHVRVQAMMAYELMRAKVSCGLWIENRDVRLWDSHRARRSVLDQNSNSDQLNLVAEELWNPLAAFVAQLKATEMPGVPGVSMFDRTTIVLASEMGRTIQGDISAILAGIGTDDMKYQAILDQDVCQHWATSSVAFLGGNVKPGTQFGRVGSSSLDSIPLLQDGSLDPAYDAATGLLRAGQTQTPGAYVSDAGHAYSTALYLSGVDPVGKGRNTRPAMTFVKRSG